MRILLAVAIALGLFAPLRAGKVRPTAPAAEPSPPADLESEGASVPATPAVTAAIPLPGAERSGPPAKPPLPEPEGLRAADLAPVTSGPAIPVPEGSRDDWGSPAPAPVAPGTRFLKLLGTVVDPFTGKPVPDVEVSLPELDQRALSGPDGLFLIHGIPARERGYELLATAPGFQVTFAELLALPSHPSSSLSTTIELKPLGW